MGRIITRMHLHFGSHVFLPGVFGGVHVFMFHDVLMTLNLIYEYRTAAAAAAAAAGAMR